MFFPKPRCLANPQPSHPCLTRTRDMKEAKLVGQICAPQGGKRGKLWKVGVLQDAINLEKLH